MEKLHFIISSLAPNQTRYFSKVARSLIKEGHTVSFVMFHEADTDSLAGLPAYNVFEEIRKNKQNFNLDDWLLRTCERFQIETPHLLFSHDRAAFNNFDDEKLKLRFCQYYNAVDAIFLQIKNQTDRKMILLQELGGFLSLTACYYVAQHYHIPNIFLEPAVFTGRIFASTDTFKGPTILEQSNIAVDPKVKAYLQKVTDKQQIAIPIKDAWRYNNVVRKVFTRYHFKRLFEKLYEKYVLGKQEEFSHIGSYVRNHLNMILNWVVMSKRYHPLPQKKFIYFPLHVPMDVSLTVRSPEYFNQIAILEYLLRVAPADHLVCIKEHPALVGAIPRKYILDLLGRYPRLCLLQPTINNFEVIKKAELIVTINSKTGGEALMCLKNVVVLGECFYRNSPLVTYCPSLAQLPQSIKMAMHRPPPAKADVERFYQNVWEQCYPGEIYVDTDQNCEISAKSVLRYIQDTKVCVVQPLPQMTLP